MYETTWRQRAILVHYAVLVYPGNNFEKCRLILFIQTLAKGDLNDISKEAQYEPSV